MNVKKVSGEIVREIELLETLRPLVGQAQPLSGAVAQITAQIDVLAYGLDYDAIRESYAHDQEAMQQALYANDWRNGEPIDAPSLCWRGTC